MHSAKEGNIEDSLLKTASMTDEFEGYAHNHAFRIALLCNELGLKFNFAPHDLISLHSAAFLHDIGEVVMMRDYIKSNRKLSAEERFDLQRHPVIGEQEAAKRGFSRAVQLLIRWHHEWWNGTGYPDTLRGEQIPPAARIFRVVDTYCALTDERPYRKALSENEAKEYLINFAGIEFDPEIVKTFLGLGDLPELKSFQKTVE